MKSRKTTRLAVGDEVDAAGRAALGAEHQARRRRCRRASSTCGAGRRRSTRSARRGPSRSSPAGASCRRGPRRSAGARRPSRGRCGWPRSPPPRRAPSSREYSAGESKRSGARLVDVDQRLAVHQRGLGADVDEAPHAGLARGRPGRCACPCTLTRSKSAREPQSPRCAAQWKATSAAGGARGHRGGVVEVAAHRLGAVRARRRRADASLRASARTVQPSATSRRTSAPPMKPEPPVTKAEVSRRGL